MLTREAARALVVAELARLLYGGDAENPEDLIILDENTIEREWGWVFFYTAERYLRTGDFRFAIAGNAPYIVNRFTAELRVTGTAYSLEEYIAEYEKELEQG